jgi:hypothetical protein
MLIPNRLTWVRIGDLPARSNQWQGVYWSRSGKMKLFVVGGVGKFGSVSALSAEVSGFGSEIGMINSQFVEKEVEMVKEENEEVENKELIISDLEKNLVKPL